MSDKLVLVVDDERPIAMLLARLAEACGAQAQVAYDGRTALEKMRAHKPALVLLDLIMPIMSGQEVLAVMETDPTLQDIPVVVISTDENIGENLDREVPHLSKPFEPADIKRLIRDAIGGCDSDA